VLKATTTRLISSLRRTQALTGAEEVDRLHSLRQTLERRERTSQQHGVRGQHDHRPRDHDQRPALA
jgi:hypothetical protein